MKEGVKAEILKVARKEFLEKGFSKTSMRTVAKNAGVSLSNIYYYYENKDTLFIEVINPLKKILDEKFKEWHQIDDSQIDLEAHTSKEYQEQSVKMLMDLTLKYKKEFYVLLFKSKGSKLENIIKDYIESATRSSMRYISKLAEKYPDLNIQMSRLFIKTMSAYNFTIIGEIVSQDSNTNEINQFMKDLVSFNTSGWKGLIYNKS